MPLFQPFSIDTKDDLNMTKSKALNLNQIIAAWNIEPNKKSWLYMVSQKT